MCSKYAGMIGHSKTKYVAILFYIVFTVMSGLYTRSQNTLMSATLTLQKPRGTAENFLL